MDRRCCCCCCVIVGVVGVDIVVDVVVEVEDVVKEVGFVDVVALAETSLDASSLLRARVLRCFLSSLFESLLLSLLLFLSLLLLLLLFKSLSSLSLSLLSPTLSSLSSSSMLLLAVCLALREAAAGAAGAAARLLRASPACASGNSINACSAPLADKPSLCRPFSNVIASLSTMRYLDRMQQPPSTKKPENQETWFHNDFRLLQALCV